MKKQLFNLGGNIPRRGVNECVKKIIKDENSVHLQRTRDSLLVLLRIEESNKIGSLLNELEVSRIWSNEGYEDEFRKMYDLGYFNKKYDVSVAYRIISGKI